MLLEKIFSKITWTNAKSKTFQLPHLNIKIYYENDVYIFAVTLVLTAFRRWYFSLSFSCFHVNEAWKNKQKKNLQSLCCCAHTRLLNKLNANLTRVFRENSVTSRVFSWKVGKNILMSPNTQKLSSAIRGRIIQVVYSNLLATNGKTSSGLEATF